MNIRGALALIKKTLFRHMSSRGFFWTLALGWMMGPLVYMFVWLIASGQGKIAGFSSNDFVVYYLCLIIINQLTYPTSHWTVGDDILAGTFSFALLRPLPHIYEAVASDLAVKIICLPFVLLVTAITGFLLGFKLTLTLPMFIVFIYILMMAQILRFMTGYALSLLAFFTNKTSSLLAVNDTLVFLLAGQVAPTALLPGLIRNISNILPYRYMLGFPIEFLLGKLTQQEIIVGSLIQLLWVLAAIALYRYIWNKGLCAYTAVGG